MEPVNLTDSAPPDQTQVASRAQRIRVTFLYPPDTQWQRPNSILVALRRSKRDQSTARLDRLKLN